MTDDGYLRAAISVTLGSMFDVWIACLVASCQFERQAGLARATRSHNRDERHAVALQSFDGVEFGSTSDTCPDHGQRRDRWSDRSGDRLLEHPFIQGLRFRRGLDAKFGVEEHAPAFVVRQCGRAISRLVVERDEFLVRGLTQRFELDLAQRMVSRTLERSPLQVEGGEGVVLRHDQIVVPTTLMTQPLVPYIAVAHLQAVEQGTAPKRDDVFAAFGTRRAGCGVGMRVTRTGVEERGDGMHIHP